MTLTIGSLCSGYGGLEMGLLDALPDARVIWHAEVNPEASGVLARHWPDVPNLGDIIGRDWSAERGALVDILAAGFPCQPVSAAGRQLATADPRWLWPAVRDAIAALAPPTVFLENVANITSILKGTILDLILSDLRALGYHYRWTILGACAVGAAHHRHRWFLRADRLAPGERVPASPARNGPAICGARKGRAPQLLPTTAARDGDVRGEGDADYWARRQATRTNGAPLGAVVTLMPTPAANSDGGPAGRTREGAPDLKTAVTLLPTPTVADARGTRNATANRREGASFKSGTTLSDVPRMLPTPRASDTGTAGRAPGEGWRPPLSHVLLPSPRASDGERGRGNPNQHGGRGDLVIGSAVQPERFGAFAAAVARQEETLGRPAPAPTEPNGNGNARLSSAFAEWLMDLPDGHVTGHGLTRGAELRMIGNGVVPAQAAAAWRLLDPMSEASDERESPMSDTTEDLQGVAPTPDADPEQRPQRATEVTDLPAAIANILDFHATPVAAQALREVLGTIGRTATEASRRMPKNRPAELRGKGWEKSSLLALAELCAALAPEVGSITSPRDAESEMFAEALAEQTQVPTEREVREAEQRAEVDRIEAELRAQQDKINETVGHLDAIKVTAEPPLGAPVVVVATVLDAEPPSPNGHEPEQMTTPERAANDYLPTIHAPDAWIEPEPEMPFAIHGPDQVAWQAAIDDAQGTAATPGK